MAKKNRVIVQRIVVYEVNAGPAGEFLGDSVYYDDWDEACQHILEALDEGLQIIIDRHLMTEKEYRAGGPEFKKGTNPLLR